VLYLFEMTLRPFDVGRVYVVIVLAGLSIILDVYNDNIKREMLIDEKRNCGEVVIVEASVVKHELFNHG
jgi:hypothetical protein